MATKKTLYASERRAAPKAPRLDAPVKEHQKYADEFLKIEAFKVRPTHPDFRDETDIPENP